MKLIIRSLIFNIFYIIWTLFLGIISAPILILPGERLALFVSKIWATVINKLLTLICDLKMEVRGLENIPESPCIIASKHQSALETIMFHIILNNPAYILKKELCWIPVFGLYLIKTGMIYIDRKLGFKAIKNIISSTKIKIENNRSVVIFPEGTRIDPGKQGQINPGIIAIYLQNIAPIIPAVVNTGYFWAKDSFIKKPGTYVIEFLPAISSNLKKEEFMHQLSEVINSEIIP